MALPVNFKDDVLASSMDGKRRYNMITNSDGTVSFEDVTTYSQEGSNFGSAQINNTNGAINTINNNVLDTIEQISANTSGGKFAGALALKNVNNSIQWKSIYYGAIVPVNVNVENKEELRLRLLLSDKQYSPYITISTEQTDGIWVLFCQVGSNIASVQFSITNNVLAYASHNFVGNWKIDKFTLEVLAK